MTQFEGLGLSGMIGKNGLSAHEKSVIPHSIFGQSVVVCDRNRKLEYIDVTLIDFLFILQTRRIRQLT